MTQTYRLEHADTDTEARQTSYRPPIWNEFFVMKPDSLEIGGVQEHHEVTG
jgi:hypothetical protein